MKTQRILFILFSIALFSCTKETQTVTSVKITNIELISYPSANGSNTWDVSTNTDPDPYLTINQGTTAHSSTFNTNYTSDAAGVIVSYSSSFPYTVSTPTQSWTFGVWDYDGSLAASEYMGGLTFKFSDYAASQPATLTLTAGAVTMKLYVEWSF